MCADKNLIYIEVSTQVGNLYRFTETTQVGVDPSVASEIQFLQQHGYSFKFKTEKAKKKRTVDSIKAAIYHVTTGNVLATTSFDSDLGKDAFAKAMAEFVLVAYRMIVTPHHNQVSVA